MKIREIKRRVRTESAFFHPLILGISAGIAVIFGALCTTGFVLHPSGFWLPRTALPSFLHILFQLVAYAVLGAVFGILLHLPPCGKHPSFFRTQKLSSLLLSLCILILSYVWIPTVCRARSFFLGVLLCCVILLALFVLFLLTYRISLFSAILTVIYSIWMFYILYLTVTLLFFAF